MSTSAGWRVVLEVALPQFESLVGGGGGSGAKSSDPAVPPRPPSSLMVTPLAVAAPVVLPPLPPAALRLLLLPPLPLGSVPSAAGFTHPVGANASQEAITAPAKWKPKFNLLIALSFLTDASVPRRPGKRARLAAFLLARQAT